MLHWFCSLHLVPHRFAFSNGSLYPLPPPPAFQIPPSYAVLHDLSHFMHMPHVHRLVQIHLHTRQCLFTHMCKCSHWDWGETREELIYIFFACNMPPPPISWLLIEQLFSVSIYITVSAWHLSVWPKLVSWWTQLKKKNSLKICLWMFPCLCSRFMIRSSNHHRALCIEMRLICLDVQADEGVTMVSGTL